MSSDTVSDSELNTTMESEDIESALETTKEMKKPRKLAYPNETFSFVYNSGSGCRWLFVVGSISAFLNGLVAPMICAILATALAGGSSTSMQEHTYERLTLASKALIGVGFYSLTLNLIQVLCFDMVGKKATRNLSSQWFNALLRQDSAFFDVHDVAGIANSIQPSCQKFQNGMGRRLGEGIQFMTTVGGGTIFAFAANWKVSLLIFAVAPVTIILSVLMLHNAQNVSKRSSEAYAKAGGIAYTTIASIKTVFAFNATLAMIDRYCAATQVAYKAGTRRLFSLGLTIGLFVSSLIFLFVVMALFGSYLVYTDVEATGCDPGAGSDGNVTCPENGVTILGAFLGFIFAVEGLTQVVTFIEVFVEASVVVAEANRVIKRKVGSDRYVIYKDCDTKKLENGAPSVRSITLHDNPESIDMLEDMEMLEDGEQLTTPKSKSSLSPDDIIQSMITKMKRMGGLDDGSSSNNSNRHISAIVPKFEIDSFSNEGYRPDNVQGKITFNNVCFSYPVRPHDYVLKNFSLDIGSGETVALVGPSGGGKSTVMSLVERFYDPLSGTVELDGVNFKDINLPFLRTLIGYVGQEPTLFGTTIRKNIEYGRPGATQEDIENAAKMANAHDFITQFPDGYDTQVGNKGSQLSGGQKQRIAIARALVGYPKILLLDEATSALDSESELVVQDAIDNVLSKNNMTTIIIAHRLSTIRNADSIAVVVDHSVVEKGTHDELMKDPNGFYRRLVEEQEGTMHEESKHEEEKEESNQSNEESHNQGSETTEENHVEETEEQQTDEGKEQEVKEVNSQHEEEAKEDFATEEDMIQIEATLSDRITVMDNMVHDTDLLNIGSATNEEAEEEKQDDGSTVAEMLSRESNQTEEALLNLRLAEDMLKSRSGKAIPFTRERQNTIREDFKTLDSLPSYDAEPQICFDNVHFAYPTRSTRMILKGLSMSIYPGETVALVGPSGGGKSTTVALLERFYDPLAGQLRYMGVDVKLLNLNWYRSQIGYVSQEPTLFDDTIAKNIAYGAPGATHEMIVEAAKQANAHNFIMSFSDGYETQVGSIGSQLSGGQKQRIAIARALVKKPEVLFFDEATSALDSESEAQVQAALDKLMESKERTIIIIAHRLSTIKNADRIAVIADGGVQEFGPHDELMKLGGRYRRLVEAQKRKSTIDDVNAWSGTNLDTQAQQEKSDLDIAPVSIIDASLDDGDMSEYFDSKRALNLMLPDSFYLLVGAFGTFLQSALFPAWGVLFAETIDLFFYSVVSCSEDDMDKFPLHYYDSCEDYWAASAHDARWNSYFVAGLWGLLSLDWLVGSVLVKVGFGVARERLAKRLRDTTFRAIVRQEVAFFDVNNIGCLMSVLQNDTTKIYHFTGDPVRAIILGISSFTIGVILAFSFAWPIAIVALLGAPFMALGNIIRAKKNAGVDQGTDENDSDIKSPGGIITETLLNIRTVSALTIENDRFNDYKRSVKNTQVTLKESILYGLSEGAATATQHWVFAVILWFASWILLNYPHHFTFLDVLRSNFAIFFSSFGLAIALKELNSDRGEIKEAIGRVFSMVDRPSKMDIFSDDGLNLDRRSSF